MSVVSFLYGRLSILYGLGYDGRAKGDLLIMTRTKLCDRQLPDYTVGEEIFNMVSHIVGGGIGVIALILCVLLSAFHGDAWAVVGSAIYGASLIALYTVSSV